MDNFVHLHAHTSIGSMQDAMTNVDEMFERAAKIGQKSLAITDHGTMAAVFDARAASKKHGVKYIPGIEAYFVDDVTIKPDKDNPLTKRRHIVLLAKNEKGYQNLLQLNWKGYQNNQYVPFLNKIFPRIDWKMLEEHHEGVVCLTACGSGLVSREMFTLSDDGEWLKPQCHQNVLAVVAKLKAIFDDDIFLEVQPHSLKIMSKNRKDGTLVLNKKGEEMVVVSQDHINRTMINVGKELGVRLVATADIHYLEKADSKTHDMLMAISEKAALSDPTRHRYEVEEFYMKTSQDIYRHFTEFESKAFAQEVADNSLEIADRCEEPTYLDTFEPRFPKFDPTPEEDYYEFMAWHNDQKAKTDKEVALDNSYMRFQCVKAFNSKFSHLKNGEKKKYVDRIKLEIEVLEFHNFSSYMLIVSDYIKKARKQGIPVGPGRGSVGGCLVAYLLEIHEVNPLEYGLLFERFQNREKKAFPDIDTDFSPEGRDWVQQYIINRYGHEKVAHVSNLSTMTLKVVVKDIARSLELGGSKSKAFQIANKITDSIPSDAKSFEDAKEASEQFAKYCEEFPELEQYGAKLVGLEKAYATHAAGIVIGDINLSTYVPLRIDKDGAVSVQYEKERCEKVGLIKMDLLGLEHLTILDNTIKNAKKMGYNPPMPHELYPFNDKDVWNDVSNGKTLCVFQMGSHHMRALCKLIKPQSVEDLSLVNALGRPSAEKSRKSYVARRNGLEKVSYKHKCLEEALGDTLGVCVYEDQLMKFANVVAGWDLNKADGLRKLTKYKGKHPELAAKLKEDFINGTMEHSKLSHKDALDIWEEIIEPFEGYGFNKPHGIFYSLNGYNTAYYKHHYPAAFMAAVLESEASKPSSPVRDSNLIEYKKEATQKMKIAIEAPDINKSGKYFTVLDNKIILTGLAAVKGVGEKAVDEILTVRNIHPFKSYEDFLLRTSSRLIRKDVIQALAKAGCFDSLKVTRKNAHDHYDIYRTTANAHAKKVADEGRNAWDILNDFVLPKNKIDPNNEWIMKEKLQGEQETLGEYISGDANDMYDGFFKGDQVTSLAKLKALSDGRSIRTEAVVNNIKQNKLKKGKNAGRVFVKCTLTDVGGYTAQMTVWPEQWSKLKEILTVGRPIRAICKVNVWNDTIGLTLERLEGAAGA